MKNLAITSIILLVISLFAGVFNATVFAVAPAPYKIICHHTPANDVTHTFQNVQSYNGHLGSPHSGSTYDTDGACVEATATPTATATATPVPDNNDNNNGNGNDDKIVWCHTEPNGNSQTLELPQAALENAGHVDANGNILHAGDHEGACGTPTDEPTATPTVTPTNVPSNPGGNGDTDGLGCAVHDCSNQSHQSAQGEVLGASTMAATGGFAGTLMNLYAIFGMMLVTAGYASYAKEKKTI